MIAVLMVIAMLFIVAIGRADPPGPVHPCHHGAHEGDI